ncbi:trans-aconitate 2-methyltransferase [Arthrobacter sp. CAN_C5]|uniref:trans-aconitate 2-methyltransferase n=1 Tax=Arthrobacter sp. CAN_C5 TaxID=2760706 RepID=UPI001AEA5014|nr:trans-aconitate 2-methyltransferase [Arthrobacter sp. CAN_C5]MBP2216806.1 trans-aconitate 2-methyltransferase [Arthrobacter sp. CAN_C5]
MRWDPTQYSLFSDHRGRPFVDLVGRINAADPQVVIDLGCGPGDLTRLLADRWPHAAVLGIDSSVDMVQRAKEQSGLPANLRFETGDVRDFSPAGDVDVVVTNAVLQWVPGQAGLVQKWARALRPGGWLTLQVPGNFGSPAHTLMRELVGSNAWRNKLGGVLRHTDVVSEPDEYLRMLSDAGMTADVWETTYQHVLAGPDPVLRWLKGTGLRPVLDALSIDDAAAFVDQYTDLLRGAYPKEPWGTVFGFRRIFAVGVKNDEN